MQVNTLDKDGLDSLDRLIKNAIAVERERCAKIALAIGCGIAPAKGITTHAGTAEAIADAIRQTN